MVPDWLLLSRDVGTSPADPRAALCSCSTVRRSKVWTLPPNTSEETGTSILRHQKQWQGAQTLWARCLGNQAKGLSWMRPSPLAAQRTHQAHPSYADGIPHATQAPQQALRVMTYFSARMGRTAPAGCPALCAVCCVRCVLCARRSVLPPTTEMDVLHRQKGVVTCPSLRPFDGVWAGALVNEEATPPSADPGPCAKFSRG